MVGLERRLGIPIPVVGMIEASETSRPTLAVKNGDDAIFETYLTHANVTGYYASEKRGLFGNCTRN